MAKEDQVPTVDCPSVDVRKVRVPGVRAPEADHVNARLVLQAVLQAQADHVRDACPQTVARDEDMRGLPAFDLLLEALVEIDKYRVHAFVRATREQAVLVVRPPVLEVFAPLLCPYCTSDHDHHPIPFHHRDSNGGLTVRNILPVYIRLFEVVHHVPSLPIPVLHEFRQDGLHVAPLVLKGNRVHEEDQAVAVIVGGAFCVDSLSADLARGVRPMVSQDLGQEAVRVHRPRGARGLAKIHPESRQDYK